MFLGGVISFFNKKSDFGGGEKECGKGNERFVVRSHDDGQ